MRALDERTGGTVQLALALFVHSPIHPSLQPLTRSHHSMKPIVAIAGCLSLALVSCQSLEHEAWSQVGKGSQEFVISSGWASYEALVNIDGQDGALTGTSGSDSTDLEPNFGLGLRYSYFLTNSWSLGLLFEYRSFNADPVMPIAAEIDADDYTSSHFILANRFYGNTFGEEDRWRVLAGIDLGFIPKVELDATVNYAPGLSEDISVEGDSYWTIGGLLGLSYLMTDNVAISFGTFYEFPLDSSDDSVTLNVPVPGVGVIPSNVDAQVKPDGFIGFVSLSYFL